MFFIKKLVFLFFFIFLKDACCTFLQLEIFLQLNSDSNHFKAMKGRRMAFFHTKSFKIMTNVEESKMTFMSR